MREILRQDELFAEKLDFFRIAIRNEWNPFVLLRAHKNIILYTGMANGGGGSDNTPCRQRFW